MVSYYPDDQDDCTPFSLLVPTLTFYYLINKMTRPKVIVVGGGAAGMMAAGQSTLLGADTLILEKMKRPGLKIGITGKGRCNITNRADVSSFIEHFGKKGRFLRQPFSQFFAPELMDFFEDIGLELVTERGGRVFPARAKAPEVVKLIRGWLKRCGVQINNSTAVDDLLITNGRITGVISCGGKIFCDAVILATGGASYPATGSTGDGYRIAKKVGHSIIPIRPALVPLETSGDRASQMAGLNLRNVEMRMFVDGRKQGEKKFGEMAFTEFGVTGPIILTLSGAAVDAKRGGRKVELALDLKPALDEKKLDNRLQRDFATRGKEEMQSLLRGLLPQAMIPLCLEETTIPATRLGCQVSAAERRRLRLWLKDFRLEVTGYRPWSEAIITAGGVDTREINPNTMESRLIKGLFIAGELLDVNGDTGGYNLQAAFSTGWVAGRSAAFIRKN